MIVDKNTKIYVGDSLIKEVCVGDIALYEKKSLPAKYQEVEYITSSRTQYINTGINANSDIKISLDLIYNAVLDAYMLYGGGVDWGKQYIQGECDAWSYFAYGNSTDYRGLTFSTGDIINVIQDKNKVYINGSLLMTFSTSSFSTNYPIYLFAGNRSNVVTENGSYKLKNCEIYDNGTLVRHFIPCYRKSDNEIGLYDTVSQTFFTNQGTGSFTKGPDV